MAIKSSHFATLEINSQSVSCLLSNDLDDVADLLQAECAGSDTKQNITGQIDRSGSYTQNIDDSDVTERNTLAEGTVITSYTYRPFGAGSGLVEITSTSGVIESVSESYATSALGVRTVNVKLNDKTYALQP